MKIGSYLIEGASDILLAHTDKEGGEPELLVDHSNLVSGYAEKLWKENGLGGAVTRIVVKIKLKIKGDEEFLSQVARQWIIRWFKQAIYLHDIGKINPVYQRKKLHNLKIKKLSLTGDSTHALLSALLYLDIHLTELDTAIFSDNSRKDRIIKSFMKHILYVFAYTISRHHTYLGNVEDMDGEDTEFERQLAILEASLCKSPDYLYYYQYKERILSVSNTTSNKLAKKSNKRLSNRHSPFSFYILAKLLYSTMVASDFYATQEFNTGEPIKFKYFDEENKLQPLLDAFHNTSIYRGVETFRQNPESSAIIPINKLRSALFDETEKQLLSNLNEHLYYLEAPTGAGKTYMSINLGLKLLNSGLELNKLLYIFPFNALIDQTKEMLDKIFPPELQLENRMMVVNSVTPIVTDKELLGGYANGNRDPEPEIDYKLELLQRQMLQYPVTLTSHVNFFNYLFGIGRESNLAFTHLCNSVIILDEIQSYKNGIWKEIIHFLYHFSEMMNIKVIIMSATLPKLDWLLETQEVKTCSLVKNRDLYFQNPLFRNRVQLHFELLEKGIINEDVLLAEVQGKLAERKQAKESTRLFIEFINKRMARTFYQRLQLLNFDCPVFELTGDDSSLVRKEVLKQLGKNENGEFYRPNVIVIATQVIEAGVDIDMDIGFKDISILDSEEQFLGRINRSCLRGNCHAYFFNMFQATKIYRNDCRTEYNLMAGEYQKILLDKDFSSFYKLVMDKINEIRKKANLENWSYFSKVVQELEFEKIEQEMKLITDKHYTLFIDYHLTYLNEAGKKEELYGDVVWEEFKDLITDKKMDYAERIIKLSIIRQKMSYFTYNYGAQSNGNLDGPNYYTDSVGNIYYVSDGERFMEIDENTGTKKFNSQAYRGEEDSQLL